MVCLHDALDVALSVCDEWLQPQVFHVGYVFCVVITCTLSVVGDCNWQSITNYMFLAVSVISAPVERVFSQVRKILYVDRY